MFCGFATVVLIGTLLATNAGCATTVALISPDKNPNRMFAGTRIGAAHDPSSILGDVLVLPVTGIQTLYNALTGKFAEYEAAREKAYVEWERRQLEPTTATITAGADANSFLITFSRPVEGFDPDDIVVTRDGVKLHVIATLQPPSKGEIYVYRVLPEFLDARGRYALTVHANGTEIVSKAASRPLSGDLKLEWTR